MKSSWTPIKAAIVLALCATHAGVPALAAGQATAQPTAAAPAKPAAAAILPGDDFFTWANRDWLDKTEIPADRGSWGAMAALADDNNARIIELIEAAGANNKADAEARKAADFYKAWMNEAAIDAAGLKPLQPRLDRIAAIKDRAALSRVLGESLRADVDPLNYTNFSTRTCSACGSIKA